MQFFKRGREDFETRLRRARRRRRGSDRKLLIAAGAAAALIIILILALFGPWRNKSKKTPDIATASDTVYQETDAADKEKEENERRIDEVIASYGSLGIVRVDGYLNIRKEAEPKADVIGKLSDGGACNILENTENGWYKISSGGIEGYVHSDYVLTDEEAKSAARELVKERAIITADRLNIRKAPDTASDVVGAVVKDERYEVLGIENGWIQIKSGYISGEFARTEPALNEARKLDLKSMVFNLYENLGISNVSNYLNVREEPGENGKIIGKLPSRAACDILETKDGWHKIQSGKIKGYVKSDFILTGAAAKDEALKVAELKAIVNTDVLNAREKPSTDSRIWTQISNSESYPVVSQQDGWVEIELENDNNAFVDTNYVDVRYALNEAIKFSPLEEAAQQSQSRRTKIVNYALQFLGNPYVWGGTSLTRGCDCSGFTMQVLGNFGVGLPHYSGSQAKMGKAVDSSSMRPGDLIFYANRSGVINHVAIYIGNGQIVHAASRRSGIKISSWNYRTPKAIRNMLGD